MNIIYTEVTINDQTTLFTSFPLAVKSIHLSFHRHPEGPVLLNYQDHSKADIVIDGTLQPPDRNKLYRTVSGGRVIGHIKQVTLTLVDEITPL